MKNAKIADAGRQSKSQLEHCIQAVCEYPVWEQKSDTPGEKPHKGSPELQ